MFSYIGGKYIIGKWIFENIPNFQWERYTEVFGGAMWVYIKRDILSKEVFYNDKNPYLYNLWLCMKYKRPELLHELIKLEPNKKEIFNSYRKDVLGEISDNNIKKFPNVYLAKKFIYVQTHVFSGLIMQGKMRLTVDQFTPFIKRLQNEKYTDKIDKIDKIYNLGYQDIISLLDIKNGFFYVDPPYYGKENYYYNAFNKNDHYKLAECLKISKSMWILSYYEYDNLNDLYPKSDFIWLKKEYIKGSSPKKNKTKETELLIYPKELEKFKQINVERFFK